MTIQPGLTHWTAGLPATTRPAPRTDVLAWRQAPGETADECIGWDICWTDEDGCWQTCCEDVDDIARWWPMPARPADPAEATA
jgi:hypothetical protein